MPSKWITPSESWKKKHGRVYCRYCGDRGKEAQIPTDFKSIHFRSKFAACPERQPDAERDIAQWKKVNYGTACSEGERQATGRFFENHLY